MPYSCKDLEKVVYNVEHPKALVKIGIVGKYTNLADSYKSLNEALIHGGISNKVKVKLKFLMKNSIVRMVSV